VLAKTAKTAIVLAAVAKTAKIPLAQPMMDLQVGQRLTLLLRTVTPMTAAYATDRRRALKAK
jgi:hypothetical protein